MTPTSDLYWDASAVISLLVEDVHSPKAHAALRPQRTHYLSSLALAEVISVLHRIGETAVKLRCTEFLRDVREGFWCQLHIAPSAEQLEVLAGRHRLRGADLWHLATALMLQKELPATRLVTFDLQLARAAQHEKIFFAG